jgi:hypothetical protein
VGRVGFIAELHRSISYQTMSSSYFSTFWTSI